MTTPLATIVRTFGAMCLSALLLASVPHAAAGDDHCDVCPKSSASAPAAPSPDSGDCDVCPKPESNAPSADSAGAEFRDCPICPSMVTVAAGSFTLVPAPGSIEPARRVTVDRSFAVSKHPVGADDWAACVTAGPCPPTTAGGSNDSGRRALTADRHDMALYAAWLTGLTGKHYRVATRAELAYAASSGVVDMPEEGGSTAWGTRIVRVPRP